MICSATNPNPWPALLAAAGKVAAAPIHDEGGLLPVLVELSRDDVAALRAAVAGARTFIDLPVVRPAARRNDPATSKAAAAMVLADLSAIQRAVLCEYRERGAMSARQAEQLGAFGAYGFSTIRKRISELAGAGYLEPCGEERETGRTPALVYRLVAELPAGVVPEGVPA